MQKADGVEPFSGTGKDARYFEGGYERRVAKDTGHKPAAGSACGICRGRFLTLLKNL